MSVSLRPRKHTKQLINSWVIQRTGNQESVAKRPIGREVVDTFEGQGGGRTLRFFHQNLRLSLPACCSNWEAPCCRASALSSSSDSFVSLSKTFSTLVLIIPTTSSTCAHNQRTIRYLKVCPLVLGGVSKGWHIPVPESVAGVWTKHSVAAVPTAVLPKTYLNCFD